MPKLILLNGNPGMGKSTLAQRYADDHPLTLNMDVDRVWFMLGQWQEQRPESDRLKYKYAQELAGLHLTEGYDVIVPQLIETSEVCEGFERIAKAHRATFKEVVLISSPEDAIERCKARARAQGYPTGFRPGGVLDTGGREQRLREMYENVMRLTVARPTALSLESIDGQVDATYARLLEII